MLASTALSHPRSDITGNNDRSLPMISRTTLAKCDAEKPESTSADKTLGRLSCAALILWLTMTLGLLEIPMGPFYPRPKGFLAELIFRDAACICPLFLGSSGGQKDWKLGINGPSALLEYKRNVFPASNSLHPPYEIRPKLNSLLRVHQPRGTANLGLLRERSNSISRPQAQKKTSVQTF